MINIYKNKKIERIKLLKKILRLNIENYIENYIGILEDGYGDMYFQDTLIDWARFNLNNRTKHDASISSGLAIMACNKNRYRPTAENMSKSFALNFRKYNNTGSISQII